AKQLLQEGANVAICARDTDELESAKSRLDKLGDNVLTLVCDVTKEDQVKHMIDDVIETYGHVDILINNAGIIQVGPMEAFSKADYEKAMDVMYWGIANTTFEVISHMKNRNKGQIVNITSVGGKVSMPHLLPYDASKFAAVGFSEGSAAELRKDNIYVTTIAPGLMRTGSYVNAVFQKGNQKEFRLFSLLANMPLATLSAETAARKILAATRERKAFKVIGPQARFLIEMHHFFPNLTTRILGLISKQIPRTSEHETVKGMDLEQRNIGRNAHGIDRLAQRAKEKYQGMGQRG
ncbi:MAG: SDR family oxidoreductase, partial [Bacteriovoracaceae bacterium]|nr:SDR family oxidoreductase [Bacteriovoracaceae bacterium]